MTNRSISKFLAGLFTASLLLSVAGTSARADDIKREGEGARRASLDKLELKAFKAELWSKLSDWSSGSAPGTGEVDGKVVVVCMWADWYAPCKRVVAQCQKLAEKYGKEGLVVIAVHNPKGWDSAKKPAFNKDIPFYSATDATGEFRKSLLSDQDPDVYVIDRAGQLRFADIDKASLEPGIQALLKEASKDAANINNTLAEKAKADEDRIRRSESITNAVDMTALPELDFTAPSAEAYKSAKWPKMPKDPQKVTTPDDEKKEAAEPPTPIALPDAQYITPKPALNGRVRLVYIWHPDARVAFNDMPAFDLIQKQRGRDVTVIGMLSIVKEGNSTKTLEADPIALKKRVKEFLDNHVFGHTLMFDLSNTFWDSATKFNTFSGFVPVPYVAIISSDGNLRWAGWQGLPSYDAALEQVLRVDPGVAARRKVEVEYMKTKTSK